jgi:ABC-type bacteriocin/lantibiotic exporter with double-glycine peptidase domain
METANQDTGPQRLALLSRFQQVAVAHQSAGAPMAVPELARCAKALKFKARSVTETWDGLAGLSVPAIVGMKDKAFIIVGKVGPDDILVQSPLVNRPQIVKRAGNARPNGALADSSEERSCSARVSLDETKMSLLLRYRQESLRRDE